MPILLAPLAQHLPWSPPPSAGRGQTEVRHIAGWTLSVRGDGFSGGQVCTLSRPRVDYLRHAVVLHLAPATDTSGAVYRIDHGPALAASADEAELASLGFALRNDDLNNPSGGLVRIPVRRLTGADTVQVETRAFGRPVIVKIGGLSTALTAAQAAGCTEEDFR